MSKPEEKPDPKPWTPADPLEDEEDENETQRRARAEARKDYLRKQYETPPKDDKKKRRGLFVA